MNNRFVEQSRYAVRTGRCPVCRVRPRARWRDTNTLRMTCGHPVCFHTWLPGKKTTLDRDEQLVAVASDEEVS